MYLGSLRSKYIRHRSQKYILKGWLYVSIPQVYILSVVLTEPLRKQVGKIEQNVTISLYS